MILLGLKRYGFNKEAHELAQLIIKGIKEEFIRTGHLWEAYDPFGGEVSRIEKKYLGYRNIANCFAGWTVNVINIMYEF